MPSSTARPTGASDARHPWSMRTHLVGIALAAVLVLVGALAYGYVWAVSQAQQASAAAMRSQAQLGATEIAGAVAVGAARVEQVAGQPALAAALARPVDCGVVVSGSGAVGAARMDVVTSTGAIACSSDRALADLTDDVHASARWLADARTGGGSDVVWPATDPVTGERTVVVTEGFAGGSGELAGVVALFLPADDVAASVVQDLAVPADVTLTVVDVDARTVVAASGSGPAAGASARLGDFADTPRAGRWVGPDGVDRRFASADVERLLWRVYAGVDQASVVSAAGGTVLRQGLTGGAALALLLVALWLLDRRVAVPLRALTRAAERARDDAGGAAVPEVGAREVADLARAFNAMLDIRAGQEARLAYQASHDRLTGLPTTDWFRRRLDKVLARSAGPGDVAVLSLGLTRFEAITAGIGPEAAERVLTEVAARLRGAVRPGDALARSGSHDFLVGCDDITPDEAVELAEHLHLAVEEPMGWPAAGVAVQASTGIALRGRDGTAEELVRQAATAMSHAQSRGRTWAVFDDSMRVRAAHQLETEQGLRDALARDELVVHYQPIVDTLTGRVVGAEALVRWMHPERGLVPPMQFIPVAEQTGQIGAIGATVLRAACRQAARWARQGRPLVMSVNVAADQLLDETFAAQVADVLATEGLPPHLLCLEVTESAVIRRVGGGADNLHRLRRLGVRVAVDDFGTGYSSLAYLQHLPITSLKIDRSFITRIEHEGRDRHLVQAVLGMAKALDLTVVAEGVETAGQRGLLNELGCDSAQGYLFGRACTGEEFDALLRDDDAGGATAA